jgi:hypothetical protein
MGGKTWKNPSKSEKNMGKPMKNHRFRMFWMLTHDFCWDSIPGKKRDEHGSKMNK